MYFLEFIYFSIKIKHLSKKNCDFMQNKWSLEFYVMTKMMPYLKNDSSSAFSLQKSTRIFWMIFFCYHWCKHESQQQQQPHSTVLYIKLCILYPIHRRCSKINKTKRFIWWWFLFVFLSLYFVLVFLVLFINIFS